MAKGKQDSTFDVLIIGGSHAGLSAALTLYRAMHTTVIFDSKKPRNHYSTPVRLTSTWNGKTPEDMKQASRQELIETGFTTFVDAEAKSVRRTDGGGFEVQDANGITWHGRKLLVTIGTQDVFPTLPGYTEVYASGIYPCMYQFGFEFRGKPSAGLLALDGLANPLHSVGLAQDGYKFVDAMTIYTDGNAELAEQISASSKTLGLLVDSRKIERVDRGGEDVGVRVRFADGSERDEAFLVHRPLTKMDRTIVDQLGLKLTPMGTIEAAPPFCKTSAEGVFAAGDCASPMMTIPNAMTMGAYAACGLARELPKAAYKLDLMQ